MNPKDFAHLAAMTGQQQQARPQEQVNPLANLDPSSFQDEICEKCGHRYFVMLFKVKKLSSLDPANPTGKDVRSVQQVLVCANSACNHELPQ